MSVENLEKNQRIIALIIGDLHIPDRKKEFPQKLKDSIITFVDNNGKFDQVFFTGDIGKGTEDFSKFLCSVSVKKDFLAVKGNMDFFNGIEFPMEVKYVFKLFPELKIGLIHGHQISPRGDIQELTAYAKKMGVNVLISGHTHSDFIILEENKKKILLNPGSCTGAWSFVASGIPSYFIMELSKTTSNSIFVKIYIYKEENQVNVESSTFLFKNERFLKVNSPYK
ncbi:MAG: YfcE family phosphodiesterase [Promethearchaeota archaeon]